VTKYPVWRIETALATTTARTNTGAVRPNQLARAELQKVLKRSKDGGIGNSLSRIGTRTGNQHPEWGAPTAIDAAIVQ
jgi:hypothetical protein